jgi:hypothetical protein
VITTTGISRHSTRVASGSRNSNPSISRHHQIKQDHRRGRVVAEPRDRVAPVSLQNRKHQRRSSKKEQRRIRRAAWLPPAMDKEHHRASLKSQRENTAATHSGGSGGTDGQRLDPVARPLRQRARRPAPPPARAGRPASSASAVQPRRRRLGLLKKKTRSGIGARLARAYSCRKWLTRC